MRCHELVFAPKVEPLAPESRCRTVYGDGLHAVDGLGGDDVLVGAERLPVEIHAHEMPAQCRSQRQGGVRRHLVRFEQMPDNAALARLALPVTVGDVGIERPVLQLDARPLRILADGESRNAVGREVYVGAPPLLQRPVEQSPVEECLVQVGTGAHAFRIDLLAVRTHDIDRTGGKTPRVVHYSGRKFEIQPCVLVAQVFALGIVAGFELYAQAARPPVAQHGRHTAREGIILAHLAPRRKFEDVHRIIPRFGEHRAAHVAAVEIVVAEPARERDLFQVAHRLGFRPGIPAVVRRGVARKPAVLLGEIYLGIGTAQGVLPDTRSVRAAVPGIAAENIVETLLRRGSRDGGQHQYR